jgi:hypothetical protein
MGTTRASTTWSRTAFKATAALISTGAALVTLLAHAQTWGWISGLAFVQRLVPPAAEAYWLGLTPVSDTMEAIGDTLHLAAVATDRHGTLLPGAAVDWISDDETVVSVDPSGTAVAMGPGIATIAVKLGKLTARSRIVVHPRVHHVRIQPDTAWQIAEGTQRSLEAVGLDANGSLVRDRATTWRSSDSSIARVDGWGHVSAVSAGSATVTATIDSVTARTELVVLPVPASFGRVEGGGQRAAVGKRLAEPVKVQVLSKSGRPTPHAVIHFELPDGAGSADPALDSTDAQGRAHTHWVLGSQPGRQRMTIRADGLDSAVVMVAEADPVPANTRVTSLVDALDGTVGEPLARPAAIRVTDSIGAAVPDVPVAWTALDGGNAEGREPRTDSLGDAHARWVLGPKAGTQKLRAQVGDPRRIPALTLHATAGPGRVANLTFVAPPKTGTAGKSLAPIKVVATDAHQNPVPGQSLTITTHSGSLADGAIVTDAKGAAEVRWTLGEAGGEQTLIAAVPGGGATAKVTVKASAPPAKAGTKSSTKPSTAKTPAPKSSPAKSAPAAGKPATQKSKGS